MEITMNENQEKINKEIEEEKRYIAVEKNISKRIMSKEVNIEDRIEDSITFGERVADNVAKFGGSWKFIISFGVMMLIWILLNTILLRRPSFGFFYGARELYV